MSPERDVDPQPMALADELVSQARSDAEQHLELVLVTRQATLGDEAPSLVEQPKRLPGVKEGSA